MSRDENDFRLSPGRSRDAGAASARAGRTLAARVRQAAARSGFARSLPSAARARGSGLAFGRGRAALAAMRRGPSQRRVTVMARLVRHSGVRFRAAPLARHIAYLERDGVTRDGADAALFDGTGDAADAEGFAGRCEGDRHHFRFIVSPEDASEMDDLRRFTRELMADMARDLDSRLDWVAVDHWNTDNPHIHILVRGVGDDGRDLIIDRGYIGEGLRLRAEERVSIELGPRSEHAILAARAREVDAERWTGLDRELAGMADDGEGRIDLRPPPGPGLSDAGTIAQRTDPHLLGRIARLEALGLATQQERGIWTIDADAERTLRDLALRNDVIKTMHRAMRDHGTAFDPSRLALHAAAPEQAVVGRLVQRGLADELRGTAFAIVEGTDGRTHHLRFDDLELTGDAAAGAIVETRRWQDSRGSDRFGLATRSDLQLDAQIGARGATWLDRQLVARAPVDCAGGFGREVAAALDARACHLEREGLVRRQGARIVAAADLVDTLKARDLAAAADDIARRTGLAHRSPVPGEPVSGICRERVTLSSGRFAMIDDGLGFQLVPWRPALARQLGREVTGKVTPGGTIDWSFDKPRGIGR